jgi:hypothetical protein
MTNDFEKMDQLFQDFNFDASRAHQKRMRAHALGLDPRGPEGDHRDPRGHNRDQMNRANRATKVLLPDKSRYYNDFTERFNTDPVFADQMRKSDVSNDGHLWFRGVLEDGTYGWLDAVRVNRLKQEAKAAGQSSDAPHRSADRGKFRPEGRLGIQASKGYSKGKAQGKEAIPNYQYQQASSSSSSSAATPWNEQQWQGRSPETVAWQGQQWQGWNWTQR